MANKSFEIDKLYYPVAYIIAGVVSAVLIGSEVVTWLKLTFITKTYHTLIAGGLIGVFLFAIVYKQDDSIKKIVLLGYLIVVLGLRQYLI